MKQKTQPQQTAPAVKRQIDPVAIFFACLIALIALINFSMPDSFLLFGLNTMSTLPVIFQFLWSASAVAIIFAIQKIKKFPEFNFYIPAIIIAIILCASFFLFRTEYPTLLGDAEPGARPCLPVIQWHLFPQAGGGRLTECISQILAPALFNKVSFSYGHTVLFDNFPISNAWIFQTLIFGIITVLSTVFVISRLRQPTVTKLGLLIFLLCSWPVLNAYGHFRSFIAAIFFAWIWFVFLIRINDTPKKPANYVGLICSLLLAAWSHPLYLLLIPYSLIPVGIHLFKHWCIRIPVWLVLCGGIALGFAPWIYRVLPIYGNVGTTSFHTGLMSCIHVSLPVIIFLLFLIKHQHKALKDPTPVQSTCIIMITANLLLFFSSYYEYAIVMDIALAMYTALIYVAAIYLFLTTKENVKTLLYSSILGVYLFWPAAYVYSNHHIADRLMKLCPQDLTSETYNNMSPYVRFGLCMPIYSREDQQRRLAIFKEGITNTIPEWQEFKGLNLIYYIAWCFEFGEIEEGSKWLIQVFNQPGALQDLWRNSTRFTDRYENRAYRRIRDVSRQIINENLKRDPSNNYLQQLSKLLDQYEELNP